MDRFSFNSMYREEVNTIFIVTLSKRFCSKNIDFSLQYMSA